MNKCLLRLNETLSLMHLRAASHLTSQFSTTRWTKFWHLKKQISFFFVRRIYCSNHLWNNITCSSNFYSSPIFTLFLSSSSLCNVAFDIFTPSRYYRVLKLGQCSKSTHLNINTENLGNRSFRW